MVEWSLVVQVWVAGRMRDVHAGGSLVSQSVSSGRFLPRLNVLFGGFL